MRISDWSSDVCSSDLWPTTRTLLFCILVRAGLLAMSGVAPNAAPDIRHSAVARAAAVCVILIMQCLLLVELLCGASLSVQVAVGAIVAFSACSVGNSV